MNLGSGIAVNTAPPTLLARVAPLLTRFLAERVADDSSFLLLLAPNVEAAERKQSNT